MQASNTENQKSMKNSFPAIVAGAAVTLGLLVIMLVRQQRRGAATNHSKARDHFENAQYDCIDEVMAEEGCAGMSKADPAPPPPPPSSPPSKSIPQLHEYEYTDAGMIGGQLRGPRTPCTFPGQAEAYSAVLTLGSTSTDEMHETYEASVAANPSTYEVPIALAYAPPEFVASEDPDEPIYEEPDMPDGHTSHDAVTHPPLAAPALVIDVDGQR